MVYIINPLYYCLFDSGHAANALRDIKERRESRRKALHPPVRTALDNLMSQYRREQNTSGQPSTSKQLLQVPEVTSDGASSQDEETNTNEDVTKRKLIFSESSSDIIIPPSGTVSKGIMVISIAL